MRMKGKWALLKLACALPGLLKPACGNVLETGPHQESPEWAAEIAVHWWDRFVLF